jgi:uncharacterized repeat protein (TIGR03809 family)
MTQQLDVAGGRGTIARWCALAEQRLEYLAELFETGRWRRFHSERALLENIEEAKAAVKTWRELSSREASSDNRTIDKSRIGPTDRSWLDRNNRTVASSKTWRDPAQLPWPAKIPAEKALEKRSEKQPDISGVPDSRKMGADAVAIASETESGKRLAAQDLDAAIAQRYPLLRNRL